MAAASRPFQRIQRIIVDYMHYLDTSEYEVEHIDIGYIYIEQIWFKVGVRARPNRGAADRAARPYLWLADEQTINREDARRAPRTVNLAAPSYKGLPRSAQAWIDLRVRAVARTHRGSRF